MLVVLDYEDNHRKLLKPILDDSKHAYKYSLLEKDIISATKIIIPDPVNIKKSFRKLNLMNLASVLRMVKSPILGINNGLSIMCREFSHENKNGLCLFDMKFPILFPNSDSSDLTEGEMVLLKSTKLLDITYCDSKVYVNSDFHPVVNEFSTIVVNLNQKNYSLLYERGNIFGLLISIPHNERVFIKIIKNFVTRL